LANVLRGKGTPFEEVPAVRRTVASFAITVILGSIQAVATAAGPQVNDVAGDANFINGQSQVAGHEQGPNARPASVDGADLLAVSFETAYETIEIIEPGSGEVVRLEHRPSALLVRIKTQGPIQPTTPPGRDLQFDVFADLDDCRARFHLVASGRGVAYDSASIFAATMGCRHHTAGGGSQSPVKPAYQGAEVTLTFPLNQSDMQAFIADGTHIRQPSARSVLVAPFVSPILDETVAGSDFVIGQDVPPDVDCVADPSHPGCEGER
jgi:hypothetical protein